MSGYRAFFKGGLIYLRDSLTTWELDIYLLSYIYGTFDILVNDIFTLNIFT